ncbi:MAG: hypothetical protein ACREJN_16150 [Nitrospiraceae bacterium]
MNNTDRAEWIDNHEPMYRWWKGSKLSKRAFISMYRAEIDAAVAHEQHKHDGRGGTNCTRSCPFHPNH